MEPITPCAVVLLIWIVVLQLLVFVCFFLTVLRHLPASYMM